jgi:DNA-binding transcriptional regulator YiaG
MEDLRARYVGWILAHDAEELVDLSRTAEWKEFEERQTPGSWIAGLRRQQGWTQKELGERLGGVATTRVSDWEHGRRAVSKSFARMLAGLFRVSAERFIA